ncbi:MAG: hypothetical protein ALECFALPRED_009325 [Alectoria fallacina]|uniref:Uncharacterized protein n=1 Tax=Alectoria fallacina TaxID=1903189 RepID=A0A8H3IHR2_9LECA|nr:MAG: hypothetical protein ALECFALPRED_009325 [Alectoria fallacina]
MATREQPFGEIEVRFLLAEILKHSSIAPRELVNLIRDRGIQPSWYEMSLPNGRSVNSCLGVWQNLQASAQPHFTGPVRPMVAFEQPSPQNAPKPKKRRPASGENVVLDRTIQPQQPFNFPPVNAPDDPATDRAATASKSGGPPKKKRGRPSKAEYEAKVAEAAARGEEYHPPPKRKKTPRTSLEGAPNAGMVTPSMTEVGAAGEGFASSKKARRLKAASEEASNLASEPAVRSLALEATAQAADQMQIDDENPVKSTIPETQASEFEARENLLADMREHADLTAPDTVQSTMTLQHDTTPQHDFTSYQGPTRDPATTGEQQLL